MIRSMEGLTLASELDVNMGYYHIKLEADSQKICTIAFPWLIGNKNTNAYPWLSRLSGSWCWSFQNIISKLVQDMEFVKINILSWWFVDTNK
jgi:hypothetical protein